MATSPAESMAGSADDCEPRLPDDLLVAEVLTRLPAAAAVRSRAVCRAWNAALTSNHFVTAHAAKAAARQQEILFFPPAEGPSTSFYTCSLAPSVGAATRELITVGNLPAEYVFLSRRPCRGLTLVRDARSQEYFVFNLSTGDHTALPPCEPANTFRIETWTRHNPRFHPTMAPWAPFEHSSAGLGFDPATGEHKVVRLFANRMMEELKCEVHTLGSGGWRPCAGKVPRLPWPGLRKYLSGLPPVAVGGSFYWLLWAHSNAGVKPHDPLMELHIIVPLCTTTGGKVVLLATGHHKVFAYDAARNAVEKVFSMQDYVDFPVRHSEARVHINVCLHEERLTVVRKVAPDDGGKRLQVKLGGDASAALVGRREKCRRLCEKCAALGQGHDCLTAGWEQTAWTAALRDHLPPKQYIYPISNFWLTTTWSYLVLTAFSVRSQSCAPPRPARAVVG